MPVTSPFFFRRESLCLNCDPSEFGGGLRPATVLRTMLRVRTARSRTGLEPSVPPCRHASLTVYQGCYSRSVAGLLSLLHGPRFSAAMTSACRSHFAGHLHRRGDRGFRAVPLRGSAARVLRPYRNCPAAAGASATPITCSASCYDSSGIIIITSRSQPASSITSHQQ